MRGPTRSTGPYDLIGTLPPGTPGGVDGVFAAKFADRLPFIVAWRRGDLGAPFTSVFEWVEAMRKAETLLQATDFEEYLTWDAWTERTYNGFAAFPKRLPEPCFPRVIDRLLAVDGLPVTADDRQNLLQRVRWLYRAWRKGHAAFAPPKVGARQKAHWNFEALVLARSVRHVPGMAHVDWAFRGLIHEIQTQKKTWRMQRWVARLRPVADEEASQIDQSFSYFDKVSAVEEAIYALTKMPMPGPGCGPVWPKLVAKYPELAST